MADCLVGGVNLAEESSVSDKIIKIEICEEKTTIETVSFCGKLSSVKTFKKGVPHSFDDKPAVVYRRQNGNTIAIDELWYNEGIKYRPNERYSAACFNIVGGGEKTLDYVEYTNPEGDRSNLKGPAFVQYFQNGQVSHEIYYIDGCRRRENIEDPSEIHYSSETHNVRTLIFTGENSGIYKKINYSKKDGKTIETVELNLHHKHD